MAKGYKESLRIVCELDVDQLEAISTVLTHFTDGPSVINAIRLIKQEQMLNPTQPEEA